MDLLELEQKGKFIVASCFNIHSYLGTSSRRDVCAVLQSNYLSVVAVLILERDG